MMLKSERGKRKNSGIASRRGEENEKIHHDRNEGGIKYFRVSLRGGGGKKRGFRFCASASGRLSHFGKNKRKRSKESFELNKQR